MDQATELRNLVLQTARRRLAQGQPAPRLVAVTAGKAGVGATTLAANLAIAMVQQGQRTVLVDATLERGDLATLCGLGHSLGVNDLLTARRDIHQVLQLGPAGVQVVSGLWESGTPAGFSEIAERRLLEQFQLLAPHVEMIILDLGAGVGERATRLWEAADDAILVTTSSDEAVMDCYATIKTILQRVISVPRMHVLVNQQDEESIGRDVFRRLNQSSQRFLGRELNWLGAVPTEATPFVPGRPQLIVAPSGEFAAALQRIAGELSQAMRARQAA